MAANAYEFSVDGICYNITSYADLTVEVTSGNVLAPSYKGDVTIPSAVTYNDKTYAVTSIGDAAFWDCTGLTSVTIPESVTNIGSGAFYCCTGLTSVVIPEGVTSIGECAFDGCTSLTSITIPEGVTSIDYDAFGSSYNGYYLKSITINSPTLMEARNFIDIFGPQVITYTIGAEIEELKDATFANFTNLNTVTLPKTLIKIGESAFDQCSALTTINIPSKVNSIGAYAFAGCKSLKSVTCENTVPPVCSESVFEEVPTNSCKLIVPQLSVTTYKETKPWNEFMIISDEDAAGIDDIVKQDGTVTIHTIDGKQIFNGKVKNASEATQGLPVGLYIINGKKVYVK